MARTLRPIHLVAVFVVAGVIGFAVRATDILDDIFPPKGTYAIVVGPNPDQLNHSKVKLSKTDADIVMWVAKTKTDKIRIEFDQEVFDDMDKLSNGHFAIRPSGTSRVCVSGEIKSGADYKEYKYTQVLIDQHGQEHPFDGRIIINK